MTSETWGIIGSIATAVGTILAGIGLIGTWLGIKQHAQALELQVLDSIFRDIRELDREFIAEFSVWNPAQKNAWSATFFNTVEYLCFFVNHRITEHQSLRLFFFDEALPEWRRLFDEHVKTGAIRDTPTMFPEFKRASKALRCRASA